MSVCSCFQSKMAISCLLCGKKFSSPKALNLHRSTNHDLEDKLFYCNDKKCGKVFLSRTDLRKHNKLHILSDTSSSTSSSMTISTSVSSPSAVASSSTVTCSLPVFKLCRNSKRPNEPCVCCELIKKPLPSSSPSSTLPPLLQSLDPPTPASLHRSSFTLPDIPLSVCVSTSTATCTTSTSSTSFCRLTTSTVSSTSPSPSPAKLPRTTFSFCESPEELNYLGSPPATPSSPVKFFTAPPPRPVITFSSEEEEPLRHAEDCFPLFEELGPLLDELPLFEPQPMKLLPFEDLFSPSEATPPSSLVSEEMPLPLPCTTVKQDDLPSPSEATPPSTLVSEEMPVLPLPCTSEKQDDLPSPSETTPPSSLDSEEMLLPPLSSTSVKQNLLSGHHWATEMIEPSQPVEVPSGNLPSSSLSELPSPLESGETLPLGAMSPEATELLPPPPPPPSQPGTPSTKRKVATKRTVTASDSRKAFQPTHAGGPPISVLPYPTPMALENNTKIKELVTDPRNLFHAAPSKYSRKGQCNVLSRFRRLAESEYVRTYSFKKMALVTYVVEEAILLDGTVYRTKRAHFSEEI